MSSRNSPSRALRDDTKNGCVADYVLHEYNVKLPETSQFKVARYSFSGSIPPKFEHKLRRHKQGFGKVVFDKDENLL